MRHLFDKAIAKRSHLLDSSSNSIRLIDGIGDGITDHFLETYADRWVIATRSNSIHPDLRNWLADSGKTVYWKQLDQSQKVSPSLLFGPAQKESFLAKESGVTYEISFQSGYSQGIFLDQRDNRKRVRAHTSKGDRILNTFAYTGAFSVCAALGGATTTTLDLSQPYLDWSKKNLLANSIDPENHFFCKGDTFHWLKRFARQDRKFDGIVLDPPTFSRDQKGKVFRVEKDYHTLIELASQSLAPGGWILASTNCRKLSLEGFRKEVELGLRKATSISSLVMPEEYTGEAYLKSLWIDF